MAASIMPYVARDVLPEEYDEFKVGYSCRRLSGNFTPAADIRTERSYVFEKDKIEPAELEQRPPKMAKVDVAAMVESFQAAMADREKRLEEKFNRQLQLVQRQLDQEQHELKKLEQECQAQQLELSRLAVYERAGTSQKVAAFDLIQFAVNQLNWKLRRLISQDIRGQKQVPKEMLFGEGKSFSSWNTVTYGTLTWNVYFAWRLKHPGGTLLQFWRQEGYPGSSLSEPKHKTEKRQTRDTAQISEYLNRAEELVSKEFGISKLRLRLLCGVYVTCMREERNEQVHLFAMYDPVWTCDVSPEQEESQRRRLTLQQAPPLVPVTNLKEAGKAPSVKVLDIWLLRTKLKVLSMVLSELSSLPEYFQIFEAEIGMIAASIRAAISKSAGLTVLSRRKALSGEQAEVAGRKRKAEQVRGVTKAGVQVGEQVSGTTLCWTEAGVRDKRTGTEMMIDEEGVWRTADGADVVDPTVSGLFTSD